MRRGWVSQTAPWHAEPRPFSVLQAGDQPRVQLGEQTVALELGEGAPGRGWCRWQGRLLPFAVAKQGAHVHVWLAGHAWLFKLEEAAPRQDQAGGEASAGLTVQVPGKVVQVLVREGDRVEAGQRLVVVESMKMEFVVRARSAGVVRRICVTPGAQVDAGALVVEIG